MDQLIPTLAALVEPCRDGFRAEVFQTFQALVAGWVVCAGPRTVSEVWQATGLARSGTTTPRMRSFILATLILTHLVPGGVLWVAVDDTLCHKRGAKVAFGGIFLDAVMSSRRYKTFRFGLNWVVLGVAVPVPFRDDRYYCLPVLWRLHRENGQPGHQPRPQAAAELARELAEANPGRTFWLVGDSAYVNAALLQGRQENLRVIGLLPWKAALYGLPAPRAPKQRGASRNKADRLPNPKAMIEDAAAYPPELVKIAFPKQERELRVQVVRETCCGTGGQVRAGDGGAGARPAGPVAGRGAGGDRPDGHGGLRDPEILPQVECGAGALRQQTVPRAARAPGAQRAGRGAGASDGVVHRLADCPVVLPART